MKNDDKAIQRTLKTEQCEPNKNPGIYIYSDGPEGQAVPAPLVTPFVLLILICFKG